MIRNAHVVWKKRKKRRSTKIITRITVEIRLDQDRTRAPRAPQFARRAAFRSRRPLRRHARPFRVGPASAVRQTDADRGVRSIRGSAFGLKKARRDGRPERPPRGVRRVRRQAQAAPGGDGERDDQVEPVRTEARAVPLQLLPEGHLARRADQVRGVQRDEPVRGVLLRGRRAAPAPGVPRVPRRGRLVLPPVHPGLGRGRGTAPARGDRDVRPGELERGGGARRRENQGAVPQALLRRVRALAHRAAAGHEQGAGEGVRARV